MPDLDKDRIKALRGEIKMANKLNEEELLPILTENVERYTGKYVPSIGMNWDIVLNEIYPIIQNNLPSIFFRNPRAFLKPRNKTFFVKERDPITEEMVEVEKDSAKSATTQENILNYTLSQMKYKKEVQKVLMDGLMFPYGVLWHGYKGDFGMTQENSMRINKKSVFVKRLSPMRFIKDPSVTMGDIDEASWVGRCIDIRLKDLVEDDSFDVDERVIKGFKGFGTKVGTASTISYNYGRNDTVIPVTTLSKSLLDYAGDEYKKSSASSFVRVYEIFLRPTKKEAREGKNGWILVLTDEQDKPLRVNEWKIKAEGWPAMTLQFNDLNDNMFGLDDIGTYKQIADQKNIIINQQIINASETGKTWVGISKQGASEEDILGVQKGGNTIITYEDGNPRDRMFVSSGGGQSSSELYQLDGRIQKNLEDKSGVTDLRRGFLQSGEESATSVKIRNAGSAVRPLYRQDIMMDFLKESFLYINQLNKQFMPVTDAVRIMGSLDLVWSENPTKEDLQADVDVEIDAISMLPESPERELEELTKVLQLITEGLTNPAIQQKLAQEGKTINLSPIIEQMLMRLKIKDPEIFRNLKESETQGFVSVQQMRQARENINASMHGGQIPYPPIPEDDHRAKLEVYSSTRDLLAAMGQASDMLEQLIMTHQALLQEIESKQATPGRKLSAKKLTPV